MKNILNVLHLCRYICAIIFSLEAKSPDNSFQRVKHAPSAKGETVEELEITPHFLSLDEITQDESFMKRQEISFGSESVGPLDVVPEYKGSLRGDESLEFSGSCFAEMNGELEMDEGGMTIMLNSSKARSALCKEVLVFLTPGRLSSCAVIKKGMHKIRLKGWRDKKEKELVKQEGVHCFVINEGTVPFLKSAWKVFSLASAAKKANQTALLEFERQQLNMTFVGRDENIVLYEVEPKIKSGDLLACNILSATNVMGTVFYGARVSHIAACLRDKYGKLYVVEHTSSTFFNVPTPPWGNGFRKTPFKEWVSIYAAHNYSVAWLPLAPGLSKKFNSEAAWEWFEENVQPFGMTRLFTLPVDNGGEKNLPHFLSEHSLTLVAALAERIKPAAIQEVLWEPISMRLYQVYRQEPCSGVLECLGRLSDLNLTLMEALAIPEDEKWKYKNGESYFCSTFVMKLLRAGGLFQSIKFNATELTPKDICSLKIFDTHPKTRLPAVCHKTLNVSRPYCQIMGGYVLEVQDFNTIEPHNNMFSSCSARDPDWHVWPDGC
ncbi:putative Zinc finger, MYND-type [Monocercomonoides exilis]|uniref:putative Zinc finger, MYND-type n=1 Tax=Monocercomonoides exilis TaxID=2049356 RepID=UPI003559865C|nr:putative Zinc finger, MYND-type [Monocercomonoides exilis]|eukprot:MONOS_15374.1-p1 / transcript=MONOS_15374.1 / gene=MONOS_15374 / organism=Monocercomonoides_exilis_PA203 / gene_product=uncharacterized protein / transcript_product=uncharacterized protein / location=Mono_scaffold01212:3845-6449(-) / protein_length=548 / sequence_SO=supercontig / SO=protein_coding / is_pseudo=false